MSNQFQVMKILSPRFRAHPLRTHRAFSLNELLIVIAIVTILVVGMMGLFRSNQPTNAQVVQNRMDVLEQQIKTYKIKYGVYPSSIKTPN